MTSVPVRGWSSGGGDGGRVVRVGEAARLDVEHDLPGRTGQLGEAGAQDVVGPLGLGSRDREVVLGAPAELLVETEHGDRDEEPDPEDPKGMSGATLAKAEEER